MLSLRDNLGSYMTDDALVSILEQVGMANRWVESNHGFDDKLLSLAAELSSGEEQRLAIARVLSRLCKENISSIVKPKLIILDEAVSNIDVKSSEMILTSLSEQAGTEG
jgi:ABC-type transport system involved in cytochrome bd biosynthesis fused ATPase/permease subunit